MLDTVRVGFEEIELDPGELMRRGWTRQEFETQDVEGLSEVKAAFVLQRKDESPHYLSWSPRSLRLKVETSFPKLLYGSNVGLVQASDVERGMDLLSERVTECVGKPIDARADGLVRSRVDFVFAFDTNWAGRGHVAEYLEAFKSLELPRHYSQNVARAQTLYWRNAARVIRMYDKHTESHDESARGVLRFEVQDNHVQTELEKLLPGTGVFFRDVAKWSVAKKILGNYLGAMGADLVIADERKLGEKLVANFGPTRARRLMGYLWYTRTFGRDGMEDLGFNRQMSWRDGREIESIGVSGTVCGDGDAGVLPGLRLPDLYFGKAMKLRE